MKWKFLGAPPRNVQDWINRVYKTTAKYADGSTRTFPIKGLITIDFAEDEMDYTNISELSIGKAVTEIEDEAFSYSDSLTTLTINGGLKNIPNGAFAQSYLLTTVNISEGVEVIGNGAFNGCSSLTGINWVDGCTVTDISDVAFQGCTGLTSFDFAPSISSICPQAFDSSGIKTVRLEQTIKNVGYNAFSYCSQMEDVYVDTDLTANSIFIYSTMSSVTLGEHVTTIPYQMFAGCTQLKYVYIGPNLSSIGAESFLRCSGVEKLIFTGNKPTEFGSNAFTNMDSTKAKIYVPLSKQSNWGIAEGGTYHGLSVTYYVDTNLV